MSDLVLDSSVVVKLVLPEPDSSDADRLVAAATSAGERLIVLDLALAEATNAIWARHHRGLVGVPDTERTLEELLKLLLHVEPAIRLLREALQIAMQFDCAIYDALFVALAVDLKLTGVTADEPLHRKVHADLPQIVLLRDC